ncbi:MAG: hypothetical protein MI975_02695 [Cytophagales bacterium]|nr:hypothetical protein [Cytophagales bacterium]
MFKKLLYILAGIITGTILIYLVEMLGHLIYPPPEGLDVNDTEALKDIIKDLPTGALLFVLLAYALGSFGGGLISGILSKSSKIINSIIVGAVLMILGFINLFMIPHPVWFSIVSLLLYIPSAYFGGRVSMKLSGSR